MPPRNPDPRSTDDKFIMEVKLSENTQMDHKEIAKLIKDTNFIEIEEKNINNE